MEIESTLSSRVENTETPPSQGEMAPDQTKGTTFLKTCFNGINSLSGVGILSIPFALAQGGWLSLLLLLSFALVFFYTGFLIQRCMDSKPEIKSFPDIGYAAFGRRGRMAISFFMFVELYLVAVGFLILEGDNLHHMFPDVRIVISGLNIGGKKCFLIATALALLPTTWVRSLGLLSYISAGGVLASAILVASVLSVGAAEGVGFRQTGHLLNWKGMPTTMSLYLFCYCGHSIFPTLCNSMRNRRQFPMVLLVCFLASTLTYGSMAIIGYMMYGESLQSQVTLNLPVHRIGAKIAIFITILNPLTKYAMVITPIANSLEESRYLRERHAIYSILDRSVIVISTLGVALLVPFFAFITAFVGAFTGVTVSILLPCAFYLKITGGYRRFGFELAAIGFIMVIGFVIGVAGTYTSLKEIVNHF